MYYPKLKERPPNFRINRGVGHPLAKGNALALLGRFPGTNTAYDSSVRKNDGTLMNMNPPTDWVWVPFLSRMTCNFDGVNNYIELPYILNPAATPFSAFAWVYLRQKNGTDSQVILQQLGDYGRNLMYRVVATDKLGSHLGGSLHSSSTVIFNTLQKWIHVGIVSTGTKLRLYVNGRRDGEYSVVPESTNTAMRIGMWKDSSTAAEKWDGYICDMFIFTRALSGSEISALADPDNVDLRVGGIPLILPPKRAWWPATVITTTSTKKRTFSQRTFNIRTFYQRTLSGPELQPQSGNVYISSLLSNSNIAVPEIKRSASISPTPAGISTFSSTPEIKRSTVIPTDPLEILTAPSIPTIKSSSIINAAGVDQKLLIRLLNVFLGSEVNITSIPLFNALSANLEIKRSASVSPIPTGISTFSATPTIERSAIISADPLKILIASNIPTLKSTSIINVLGLDQKLSAQLLHISSGYIINLASIPLFNALSANLEIKRSASIPLTGLNQRLVIISSEITSGSKVDLSSLFLLNDLSTNLEIKTSSVVVMIALQDNLYIIPIDVARRRFDASVFAKTIMPSLNI